MSDVGMEMAKDATDLFMDGTFATCPRPFYQKCYLRGKIGDQVFTLGYALLPNKLQQTYEDVLQFIADLCADAGMPLDPIEVHTDGERGIINAAQKVFPRAKIQVCFFHVVDAIRKKFDKLGLRPLIDQNEDFRQFYQRVKNIFFLPAKFWPDAWAELLANLDKNLLKMPAVKAVITYLTSTWIPTASSTDQRIRPNSVLYSPSMTGLYDVTGEIITNNFVETHHAKMKKKAGDNPSLAKTLEVEQKEETSTMIDFRQRDRTRSKQRPEDRERAIKRREFRASLKTRIENGANIAELVAGSF